MYVNVYYLLLQASHIPERDREMCVNFTGMYVTAGITLACAFILMMDNTFLANK